MSIPQSPARSDVRRPGPSLPRIYVPRARLWEELDQATRGAMTVLVAPAGAGKTLGVSGWLRAVPAETAHQAVWVDGDAPDAPEQVAALLGESGAAEHGDHGSLTADGTVEPMSGQPSSAPRLLVVDDAQALPAATLRILDERLNRAPETMRVLLLSRWDLALTHLVPELLGHLTTLRGDLLRLTADESAQLISAHARTDDPEVVRLLSGRTRGWCGAAVLAARTVGAAYDPVAEARRLAAWESPVADMVANEVFATMTPQQRHLLLCVGKLGRVSALDAVRLTHDPQAAEVLAGLEATGVLVSRVRSTTAGPLPADERASQAQPSSDAEPVGPVDACYRIHPLLVEVIRRRVAAGGVDVERARGAVVRAVRLDVASGHVDDAFARLAAVGAAEEVADLLARHGVRIVLTGRSSLEIASFAQTHADIVDARAELWFPLALECWLADDLAGARHWGDRVLQLSKSGDLAPPGSSAAPVDPVQVGCVRLWRAMLGVEQLETAIGYASRLKVAVEQRTLTPLGDGSEMPVLLTLLGVAQAWTGDLAGAESSLTLAVGQCRSHGFDGAALVPMTHLALAEYAAGRERAAVELARDVLSKVSPANAEEATFTAERAALVLDLSALAGPPFDRTPPDPRRHAHRVHGADLPSHFWTWIRDARRALMSGSAATTKQILLAPGDSATLADQNLPTHLRAVVLAERGLLAALSSDGNELRSIAHQLEHLDADGERCLIAGLRADLAGDRPDAANAFESATMVVCRQPMTRTIALVCQAQLLDAMGDSEAALSTLALAATETEVSRNAVPFLGWTRQGTPMAYLLARLHDTSSSPWVAELHRRVEECSDLMASLRSSIATPHEQARAAPPVVLRSLSPREREVLTQLARGASYADIAALLFISENTVKTHVSGLYGKLAVSRRRDALAVARAMHLI